MELRDRALSTKLNALRRNAVVPKKIASDTLVMAVILCVNLNLLALSNLSSLVHVFDNGR